MRQRRPGAPWRKRVRDGHDPGATAEPRPADPEEGEPSQVAEVVSLTTGGRSWDDLLSEAVDGSVVGDATGEPDEATTPLAPSVARHGEAPARLEDDGSPFGERLSEIVLPGGRRVTRYRLPLG